MNYFCDCSDQPKTAREVSHFAFWIKKDMKEICHLEEQIPHLNIFKESIFDDGTFL